MLSFYEELAASRTVFSRIKCINLAEIGGGGEDVRWVFVVESVCLVSDDLHICNTIYNYISYII